jgi:hypothetical protein
VPSPKTIVWTAAIALAVNVAYARVQASGGAGSRLGV